MGDWCRRKGVLLLEIFYCYKGISEGWSGWGPRAPEERCVGDWCRRKGVLLYEIFYYYIGISEGCSGWVPRAPEEVEWETGVEGKEYYFWRFFTVTKG